MSYDIEINSLGNQIYLAFEPTIQDLFVFGVAELSIWDIDFNFVLKVLFSDIESDYLHIKNNEDFNLRLSSSLGGFIEFKKQKENVLVLVEYDVKDNPFGTNSNAKTLNFQTEFFISLDEYQHFVDEYKYLCEWLKKENGLL
jgi:hypothetical protein